MKSVSDNLHDLRSLSAAPNANQNLLRLLADVNESLLLSVIKVLEPFDVATKLLSCDSKPSIDKTDAASTYR